MFSLIFFGLVAAVAAAPHYHHHHRPSPYTSDEFQFDDYLSDRLFDTRRFWNEMKRELLNLDNVIDDMTKRFPTEISTSRIERNVYKVKFYLSGFSEKDIVVKARKGLLTVQATRGKETDMGSSYMGIRTLPDYVNEAGNWKLENGVLNIEFPLIEGAGPTAEVTTVAVTLAPDYSSEIVKNHSKETTSDVNIEVGHENGNIGRGDLGNREVQTNEIESFGNNVEATTYAVDFKDEVEFVPVNY